MAPVNIYILLDGCLTHDHVSESGLIVCIEKAQSERGRGTWSWGSGLYFLSLLIVAAFHRLCAVL